MKITLLLVISLLSFKSFAEINQLIRCIAQEESAIHKEKLYNHHYRLNQAFMNGPLQDSMIYLKKEYQNSICAAPVKIGVSVKLIELFLTKREDAFVQISKDKVLESSSIDYFLDDLSNIFYQYIMDLQYETGVPNCLTKKIPLLKEFFDQIQYLSDTMPTNALIEDKSKMQQIFNRLANFDKIVKECKNEKAKEEKEKEKEKEKGKKAEKVKPREVSKSHNRFPSPK